MTRHLSLCVLGATGSIGESTLDVVARHPGRFSLFALTGNASTERLIDLCVRFRPRYAVLSGRTSDDAAVRRLRQAGCATELMFGEKSLVEVAAAPECDVVMAAIVGAAGLAPALAAARAGKRVLLANKEALVMAGPLFMQAVRDGGAQLLPIDSEHNAVFQCLPHDAAGRTHAREVRRILLTASGGPFRSVPIERLAMVTPEEACAHPNWVMGRKISVDSATMMNKGLEVIEACLLFGVTPERVEVLIHPQSIVHSLVEFVDGSALAQLSNPDMRVPIAYALAYPERVESGSRPLDLAALGQLSFEAPDPKRFPCLGFAYAALRSGGTAPAILNAANEVAVSAFLARRIRFSDIPAVIESTLAGVARIEAADLGSILAADAAARASAGRRVVQAIGRAA
ncbi:MAG: 1-deoxy-D-xylulose-5-phosphate reductoisomerase [Betaproteobacteria bacterium]|nr:1-deoxy-D-xylulose-5-phosphate reductoisomerase [Betaproteobacteria bacterium]